MSKYVTVRDCKCQTCNEYFAFPETRISTVINMDIDCDETNKFKNFSLNRVKCRKCFSEFTYETGLLIFSYNEHYAVFVNPYSDFKSTNFGYAPDILFPEHFYFREVSYLIEAREKLNLLRDGLDDIFIEKLKKDHFSDEDTLPFNMVSMIYTHHDENNFYFTKYDFNENPIKEFKIKYNKSIETIKADLRKDRWIRVNRYTVNQLYKGE